jgi:hypothetical protein
VDFEKNSKDLLDNLKSRSFSQVSSIKTFDLRLSKKIKRFDGGYLRKRS